MARALDRCDEHSLMLCAGARDPFRDDPALFRNESLEFLLCLVINIILFVVTEAASSFLSYLSRCASL
jgi:hypothetical protein